MKKSPKRGERQLMAALAIAGGLAGKDVQAGPKADIQSEQMIASVEAWNHRPEAQMQQFDAFLNENPKIKQQLEQQGHEDAKLRESLFGQVDPQQDTIGRILELKEWQRQLQAQHEASTDSSETSAHQAIFLSTIDAYITDHEQLFLEQGSHRPYHLLQDTTAHIATATGYHFTSDEQAKRDELRMELIHAWQDAMSEEALDEVAINVEADILYTRRARLGEVPNQDQDPASDYQSIDEAKRNILTSIPGHEAYFQLAYPEAHGYITMPDGSLRYADGLTAISSHTGDVINANDLLLVIEQDMEYTLRALQQE